MLTICWCSKLAPYPGRGHSVPEPSKDVGEGCAPHAPSSSVRTGVWPSLSPRQPQGDSASRAGPSLEGHTPRRCKYCVAFCDGRTKVWGEPGKDGDPELWLPAGSIGTGATWLRLSKPHFLLGENAGVSSESPSEGFCCY